MKKTLYIGAKCVPSFYIGSGGSSEWVSGVPFEPLTVVTYNNTWFISKKPVPAGTAAPQAGEYWAQVPGYVTNVTTEELQAIIDDIEDMQEAVGDLDDLDTTAKTNLVSAVNEVKGETTELRDDLEDSFYINGNVRPTLINGKFVDNRGNISNVDTFSMTEPIAVKKGQTVTLTAKGYLVNVAMIATCNSDNTSREVAVLSIDSDEHDYVYNVTEDGYIVCSLLTSNGYKLSINIDYYSELDVVKTSISTIENSLDFIYEGTKNVDIVVHANAVIDATNNKYNSGGNFNLTESVHLYKGQTVNLTATGWSTVIGMINLYNSENDTYQTVVRSNGNTEQTYSYTATNECDVRMCYLISAGASANIVTDETDSVRLQSIEAEIDKGKNASLENVEYPQMFTNVICIGDSLTYGHDGNQRLTTNYPFYFGKLTDCEISNQGLSGRTTKQWWDQLGSTFDHFADYDCAIIYLGTNGGLTDTVETDCNASDYTQNADTNTGCYGKIIGKIKANAPNCKIFCVCGVNEYLGRENTMNVAVRKLADLYEVGLIDISHCIMDDDGTTTSVERYLYRPVDGIHYNRLGYMTFANMIYDYMKEYMANHLQMYV